MTSIKLERLNSLITKDLNGNLAAAHAYIRFYKSGDKIHNSAFFMHLTLDVGGFEHSDSLTFDRNNL